MEWQIKNKNKHRISAKILVFNSTKLYQNGRNASVMNDEPYSKKGATQLYIVRKKKGKKNKNDSQSAPES